MRRIALPLAAAALAAAAPLALSAPGAAGITKAPAAAGDTSIGYQSHGKATKKKIRTAAALRKASAERRKRARRAKPANLVLKGCVVEDVVGDGVELDSLKGNSTMRRLLEDADTFFAPLSERTRVVMSKSAQMEHGENGALGTIEDLWAGDRIVVRWRVARGTAADALPAAMRVINLGPHDDCVPDDVVEEYPGDAGDEIPVEEPVTEEPATQPLAQPTPADSVGDDCDEDDADHVDDDEDEVDEHEDDDQDHHHRRGRR